MTRENRMTERILLQERILPQSEDSTTRKDPTTRENAITGENAMTGENRENAQIPLKTYECVYIIYMATFILFSYIIWAPIPGILVEPPGPVRSRGASREEPWRTEPSPSQTWPTSPGRPAPVHKTIVKTYAWRTWL